MSARKRTSRAEPTFAFDAREALRHLRASDAVLARLIDTMGPFRMELKHASSLFDVLLEAIVYQQLNGKAAAATHARVRALMPRTRAALRASKLADVDDETLRAAGLSRAKTLALRDLVEAESDGRLPTLAAARRMDDEALIARLVGIRGIGRWTAQMLLMFRLGRGDVLPVDDYGVRKGFAVAFGKREMPTRAAIEQRAERWRPYRSVASWYLWRAAETKTI